MVIQCKQDLQVSKTYFCVFPLKDQKLCSYKKYHVLFQNAWLRICLGISNDDTVFIMARRLSMISQFKWFPPSTDRKSGLSDLLHRSTTTCYTNRHGNQYTIREDRSFERNLSTFFNLSRVQWL